MGGELSLLVGVNSSPLDKMAAILEETNELSWTEMVECHSNYTEICSYESNW